MTTTQTDPGKPVEHVVRAFAIAPLVAVIAPAIAEELYFLTVFSGGGGSSLLSSSLFLLMYVMMLGLPIAYTLTLLVCTSVYAVLRGNGVLSQTTVVLSAVAIIVPILVLGVAFQASLDVVVVITGFMALAALPARSPSGESRLATPKKSDGAKANPAPPPTSANRTPAGSHCSAR